MSQAAQTHRESKFEVRFPCPEGEESSLRQAAQDLDNRLQEMAERTKVSNPEKLLTIAALNVCYELQQTKSEKSDNQEALSDRIEQLSASLDDALKNIQYGS